MLPPSTGTVPRIWCSDACRKRLARLEAAVAPTSSAVRDAIEAALREHADRLDSIGSARVQVALRMAEIVDGGTAAAVPAAKELRVLLADLAGAVDGDFEEFLSVVQTPGRPS